MASTSDDKPFNGTVPLTLSFIGAVLAFVGIAALLFWIDPAGTKASCAGVEACIDGKVGLLKLEVVGGIVGGVLLMLGILGILKKPSAH